MVDITTRSGKGSALTHAELDANFTNLKTAVETNVTDIADAGGVTVYATIDDLPLSGLSAGDLAYVSGTNRLYLSNSTGWYNIALVNQTPTISGNEAVYSLENDGTATTVTLSSTDPEGIPITWSATTSGDTNAATVTNVDNVFTITPSTNLSDAGSLTVTFRASDGVNIGTSNSVFTLGFLSANWKYVSLAVGTVSGNSETNSSFTDSSSNGLTTTAVGNASQGGFHPFLDNWSVDFTESDAHVRISDSTDLNLSGDFTIELWAKQFAYGSSNNNRIFQRGANSTTGYGLFTRDDGTVKFGRTDEQIVGFNQDLDDGLWHHFAVTRSSNTVRIYFDGVMKDSATLSDNLNQSGDLYIASYPADSTDRYSGFISNFRLVNGSALYTTDTSFTVPTEKLTDVTNTKVLTLQGSRFVDNSANGLTVTPYSSAKISASNPFGQGSEYATGGGKGGFHGNGSDAGLAVTQSGELNLSATAYTIEGWCYLRSFSGGPCLFSQASSNSTHAITADTNGNAFVQYYVSGTNRVLYTSTSVAFNLYAWNHFALVCDGDANNTTRFYVDGVEYLSWTDAYTFSDGATTSDFSIGYYAYNNGRYLDGYIADFKVTKSAKYTSAFTPPTSALGNTDAELYLTFDDAGIYDKTANHALTLGGDTATSTTQTKYADTSIYFDGTGDYMVLPSEAPTLAGDFTIEFWIRPTSSDAIVFSQESGNWVIALSNYAVRVYDTADHVTTSSLSQNVWAHVALVRSSGDLDIYINGTSSVTSWTNLSTTKFALSNQWIGARFSSANFFQGYMEGIQILNGVAKYTSNFTPPSQEQGRSYQEES